MAIAAGVIVAWPGSAASIPAGWTRVTDLDGRYARGVANAATNPGATGGSATHTHTTSSHTHTINHTHESAASASAGAAAHSNTAAAVSVAGVHTHTFSAASSGGSSGAAAPDTDAQSNDPAHLTVIWIASDGSPDEIPAGALAMFHDASLPPGWGLYGDAQNRFLKGAGSGGDGGTTAAGNASHTHTAPHTHTSDHTHTSTTSSGPSSTSVVRGFDLDPFATTTHTHGVTFNSGSGGTLPSTTLGISSGTNEPNYIKSAIIESPGDLQVGIIALWRGTLASIPEGWALCDGTNGTPNLLGAFIKGAGSTDEIGDTGGSQGHGHSGSSHSHSVAGSHTHNVTFGAASATTGATTLSGSTAGAEAHSTAHNTTSGSGAIGTSGGATPSVGTTSDTRPPFEDVAFIQLQTPPEPTIVGSGGIRVGGSATTVFTQSLRQVPSNIVVEWDFDNDGDFDEPEEDITPYVLSLETFTGRDWPSLLAGKAGPGKLRATLRNDDDRFNYFNASSPLVTAPFSLRTGRKIRVRTTAATSPDPILLARDRFRRVNGVLGSDELGNAWSGPFSDDFTVVGEQAAASSEGDAHMAVLDVGETDYYAQVSNTEAGLETNVVGLVYRYQDSNDYSLCVVDVAAAELQLINVVSGTATKIASEAVETYDRMTIGVLVSGSTVTAYLEGVPIMSATAIQTDETEVGFYCEWGNGDNRPAFDDFFVWDALPQEVEGILWTGDVSDLVSSVQAGPEKQAAVSGEGWLSRLAGQMVRPPASIAGRKTGLLVGNTLAMARMLHPPGWIAEGDVTTGPFGMEESEALDVIRRFEETEFGFLYESQEGYLSYDNRTARDGATSLVTFSDAPGAQLGYHRLEPYDWRREIVNRVFAGVTAQVPSGVSVTTTTGTPFLNTTPVTINMPATVNEGDLLLVVVSAVKAEGVGNFAAPPTWQELASNNDLGEEYGSVLAYAKVADGSEGNQSYVFGVTEATITNGGWAAQVYRVTDWFGELQNGLAMGSYAGGSNSPVVFPSWGLQPSLFIAVRHGVRGDATAISGTDYPTGYGNGVSTSTETSVIANGAVVQSAYRIAVAAVENPAAFGGTFGPFQLTASVVFAVRGPNGDPPLDNGNVTVMVDDVASQDDHNAIRTYRSASNLFASTEDAETYANLVLARYADDRPILAMSFYATKSAAYRAQAFRRRVGDKITLIANYNSGFGISGDFFIESIAHKWSHGVRLWETTWELSPA